MSIFVIISVVCNLLTIVVQSGVNFRSSCFYLLASLLLSACLCAFVCLPLCFCLFVSVLSFVCILCPVLWGCGRPARSTQCNETLLLPDNTSTFSR